MRVQCDNCGQVYETPDNPMNCMVFCSRCGKKILTRSLSGEGPVIPCDIYIDGKKKGVITIKHMGYRLISDELGINEPLSMTLKGLVIYSEAESAITDVLKGGTVT